VSWERRTPPKGFWGQWRRDIRSQLGLERSKQRRELERRSDACFFPKFGAPIYIEGGRICTNGRRGEESVELAGAEATVTASGDVHFTGGFLQVGGVGVSETTDTRELYLTVKANDGELVARLGPEQQQAAREFARSLSSPMRRSAVVFSERPPSCRAC
jgi:hypothetical protein